MAWSGDLDACYFFDVFICTWIEGSGDLDFCCFFFGLGDLEGMNVSREVRASQGFTNFMGMYFLFGVTLAEVLADVRGVLSMVVGEKSILGVLMLIIP